MQKYKILVAYDGSGFHGWQIQPNGITVTSRLESSFYKVFGKKIVLLGASRTDAGVHALGQVAQFYVDLAISDAAMLKAWNKGLPSSIVIRSLEKVSELFHPCRNVRQKTYYYHLFTDRPLPFVARYGWFYDYIHKVDFNSFEQGLQLYVGTHDFASFCKVDDDKETVRTIDSIDVSWYKRWSMIRVTIKGKSFLRFQIRRMVGYALDVARRDNLSVNYLKEVLECRDPQQTLLKAAAGGLCLRKVIYHDE